MPLSLIELNFCKFIASDEKWILYDNPKRRKSWIETGQPSTSTAKLNIHAKKVLMQRHRINLIHRDLLIDFCFYYSILRICFFFIWKLYANIWIYE